MPQNRKKLVRRYSVAAFLASFNPSLAHLHPVFTKAEIDNHQCLKTLATWGPFHIKEFFGANDLIIPRLDNVSVQKFWTRRPALLLQFLHLRSAWTRFLLPGRALPPCRTGRSLYDAILCPAFLASFNPSLAHLLPVFTKVEIDNHECLKSLATWGPFHIKDFFGANDTLSTRRLDNVSVQKFWMRSSSASATIPASAASAWTHFLLPGCALPCTQEDIYFAILPNVCASNKM
ncbi:hypothetical protein B0H14DRAFT_3523783 [Mycena olivaceomarginata]|nr:hypothetical protein B0H14DRAFT_3523783 [Mycena olivaceomarginata]